MAYTAGGVTLLSHGNGFGMYRYDSLDAETLVRVDGYFNNNDDDLNFAVGDIVGLLIGQLPFVLELSLVSTSI